MKKTVKILSVLLGFILALTPILSLTVSASDAANGQSSTYNADYQTAKGKLAITEINGANPNNTAYQYIEITNNSNTTVSLSDYYLYRWSMHNKRGWQDTSLLRAMLGVKESWHDLTRVSLADCLVEDVVLQGGETVVVWLNMNGANASGNATWGRERVDGEQAAINTLGVDDFRSKWQITDSNVKVANLKIMGSADTGDSATDEATNADLGKMLRSYYLIGSYEGGAVGKEYYNAGFLPLGPGICVLELMHKDANFSVTTTEGTETLTPDTDVADFILAFNRNGLDSNKMCGVRATATNPNDQGSIDVFCYDENAKSRYAAGDCCALWFTDMQQDTKTPVLLDDSDPVCRNFYGFMDTNKYSEITAVWVAEDTTARNVSDADIRYYSNFVTNKLTETGEYGNGYGIGQYKDVNQSLVESTPFYFAHEGDIETPTPGTLNAGQFGYGTSVQAFGKQVKTEGNTYSVRFTASLEADALLAAKKVGFDIVAKYTLADGTTTGTKNISKDCTTVYASIYGKGTDGAEIYTKADLTNGHEYFYSITVENISIEKYENIIFEVTPYIINQSGVKISAATATATYDDGAAVENA